jgi:hypothetical protein
MTSAGIIITVVVCLVGFFILKPLVGYFALRRDPISAGQSYLKHSFSKISPSNAGLISDEAYKQLANKAFQYAEFCHKVERQSLFGCYMSQLDFYVQQIEYIMTGEETDLDGPVGEVLKKHGVPIPKAAV